MSSRAILQRTLPRLLQQGKAQSQLLVDPQQQHWVRRSTPLHSHFFSSAAVQTAPKSKKRRIIDSKDPIIVTDRAAERIHELLQQKLPSPHGIRLGVRRRGCNGLSYTLNYAYHGDKVLEKDILLQSHGITVYIEPMALFNIVGTTMDWKDDDMVSEFTFQNPNSKGECGCGESFTV